MSEESLKKAIEEAERFSRANDEEPHLIAMSDIAVTLRTLDAFEKFFDEAWSPDHPREMEGLRRAMKVAREAIAFITENAQHELSHRISDLLRLVRQ